ncbi:intein C-terminal splicing region/RHS repeat-associated core domain-containing protein [Actinoplanes derwentensis]|uniref:Intein C-terminal splicing region/RHS repeat-associated core domain-containing protein n=1 Tax=Actinoplanes derwentensis TaxID=113562 RepID=A0A1H2D9L7_9ACTN|nr:intein C-terminal splicing region/RHS repeat-associated core domain-containing protein [Actinoplanes derwentensis]
MAKACDETPSYPADAVSDVRTLYDSGAYGDTPTKGDVTGTQKLSGYTSGVSPQYTTVATSEYDGYGRVSASYDAKSYKTKTDYIPASGGPVTGMKVTDPAGFVTTSTVDPAWGLVTATVDANLQRTDQQYDALGRLIKVWLPGRTKGTDTPNLEYDYLIRTDGPVVVTTRELLPNGGQQTSYQLYDGLLRARQSQSPTPNTGRVITETVYDSRGLATRQVGPYYNSSEPGTTLVDTSQSADGVPPETATVYDGAGRATAEIFKVAGAEKWRTTVGYHGDHTDVTPPSGETPTTTYTDAQGRTTKLLEYRGSTPTGTADTTVYNYTKAGLLNTVKDQAGHTWQYGYDPLGRQTSVTDPDTGTSSTSYNVLDQVVTTTDGRNRTLTYSYDALGRTTSVYEGTTQLTGFTYDSATNGKGRAGSAIRYVNGAKYETAIGAYDAGGRPTSQSVTIPSVENNLAGTYTFTTNYKVDGSVNYVKLPAAGGLTAETLYTGYNASGFPSFLLGTSDYVRDTTYSNYGEPLQVSLGTSSSSKYTWLTYAYETGTRRLQNARVDREIVADADTNATYTYDATGNITKIADAPTNHTADVQCFQYDYLRRLTQAWTQAATTCAATPTQSILGGPAPYWQSFSYDTAGNRTGEITHATTSTGTTVTKTYTPNGVGTQPAHAVKQVAIATTTGTSTVNTSQTFLYDKSGNAETRTLSSTLTQKIAWDAERHVTSITQGANVTSFVYDASGQRLIRRDPATKSVTLYLGAMELKLNTTNATPASQTVTATRYYSHNGQTIAMRTTTGVTWLAGGQNGTAELAVNASTSALTQRRTLPFGEQRGTKPTWPGEQGFVGGTMDATTGLTHLGAREYDQASGRFLSVDPVIDFGDPQQLHGYAYGRNNPLAFPDPTGLHWGWSDWGHAALDVVGLVPVLGEWADAVNGVWYAAEGDWVNAGLSFASVIPVAGYAASAVKGAKYVDEAVDVARATDKALEGADAAVDATKAADNLTPPAAPKTNPAPKPDPPAAAKSPDGGTSAKPKDGADAGGGSKADSGGSCKHSFAPATLVLMADGSAKAIDEVQPGDEVMATDPDSGETVVRTVEATHVNLDHELTDLTVSVGDQTVVLHTTQNHPFYSETRKQWVDAADLRSAEEFRTTDGTEVKVGFVRNYVDGKVMHDLTVNDLHTYYVVTRDTSILVHNCPTADGGSAGAQTPKEPTIRMRHYTNSKGAAGIVSSKMIKASDQNKVFMVPAKGKPMSPSDAESTLGIRPGRGRKVLEFDIPASRVKSRHNSRMNITEWVVDGDVAVENIRVVR